MTTRKMIALALLLALLALAGAAAAQEPPESPEVGVCLAGTGYASGCDVDQDGDIDIFDIQRTAGRWNSSGTYTSGHTHFGETWTGSAPEHGLHVENTASSGSVKVLYGMSASSSGRGVYGYTSASTGPAYAVVGESASTAGVGVYGYASASSGLTWGTVGKTDSPTGHGVYGYASATSGAANGVTGVNVTPGGNGVLGSVHATTGVNNGVYGESDSTDGRGVYGYTSAASGNTFGMYGKSDSATGTGVYGFTASSSGATRGVHGLSNSTDGYGGMFEGYGTDVVYVENLAGGRGIQVYAPDDTSIWARTDTGFAGVDGRSASASGRGLYGYASANSGTNYGVYGRTASASGYAGYFDGRVTVLGNFSVGGSKAFQIDHPLDPANRYLYHFAQESPEVQNVYNGVVTLDADGTALVTLPEYFSALNSGVFRYQLTAIGVPMPNLYVARKIESNSFEIAGGAPGMEVSWEVTAVRNDPYLRDHAIQAEVDKPAGEQGAYLYPQGYGQPEEMGLDYQRNASFDRPSPPAE